MSKGPLFFILWLFISWWKEAAFLSTDTFLQPPSFSVGGEPVGNAIKTLRFLPLAASPIIAYQRAKNRPKKSEEGNNCSMSAWLCRRRMGLKFDKERVSTRLASIWRRLALVITDKLQLMWRGSYFYCPHFNQWLPSHWPTTNWSFIGCTLTYPSNLLSDKMKSLKTKKNIGQAMSTNYNYLWSQKQHWSVEARLFSGQKWKAGLRMLSSTWQHKLRGWQPIEQMSPIWIQ